MRRGEYRISVPAPNQADAWTGFDATDASFLAVKLTLTDTAGGDSAYLYVDPDLGFDPSLDANISPDATLSNLDIRFDRIRVGGAQDAKIDAIRFGETYSSVIPEPSSIGLLVLALAGAIRLRLRGRRNF